MAKNTIVRKGTLKLLREMLVNAAPYRKFMIFTIFSVIIVSATQLVAPLVIRRLVAIVTSGEDFLIWQAILPGILLAVIFLIRSVFQGVRTYVAHKAAWNFVTDIRIKVYNHIQEQSLNFFHNKQVGQLLSRIVNDPANLETLIAHVIPDMLVNFILLIGILILLFVLNPLLAAISVLFLPVIFYSVYRYSIIVRPLFRDSQQVLAELSAVVAEDVSGIREIQAFNKQSDETLRVTKAAKNYSFFIIEALKKGAIFHPRIEFYNNLTTAVVLAGSGILAINDLISIADIVAFMLYLGLLQGPVSTLGRLNEDFQTAMASIERYDEVLQTQTDILERDNPLSPDRLKGEIKFSDVNFAYIEDSDVLTNVNFTIKPGKMLAIVGPTGAGKSTIANLLMRFYDADSGNILLDGNDIKDYSLKCIRDNTSIVMQDIFLFNGTVYENIAFGAVNPSADNIRLAADMAHATEFIMAMPQGFDTLIGERGVKLSGGQKQRISIARALLKNAPILILDEATASVDMFTERQIQDAISEVIKDRSTVVIAHRLSTIMHADEILYLDGGKIVERGTHGELLREDGQYAQLWRQAELSGYKPTDIFDEALATGDDDICRSTYQR